jgi:hypothetical protein
MAVRPFKSWPAITSRAVLRALNFDSAVALVSDTDFTSLISIKTNPVAQPGLRINLSPAQIRFGSGRRGGITIMPHHGMAPHISGTSLSAEMGYAAGTREILE